MGLVQEFSWRARDAAEIRITESLEQTCALNNSKFIAQECRADRSKLTAHSAGV